MLEPVVLQQSRFNAPGLAADPRGVALGKQGGVLLPTIDAVVGWFRVLSDEIALDDILPQLAILELRGAVQSREFLIVIPAQSSHLLDRAARVSRMLGGLCFTGTGKHLVQYRDHAAPLGYDVTALAGDEAGEGADLILYATAFTQGYRRLREVPFGDLVFRLAPRPVPIAGAGSATTFDAPAEDELQRGDEEGPCYLTVPPGLAARVIGYLYRSRVPASAARVEPAGPRSAFTRAGAHYLLVRAAPLPRRMRRLFASVPGIALHRPIGGDAADNVVVEEGYRHPIRLESCASIFDRRRFYLFRGGRGAVEVLAGADGPGGAAAGPPVFTPIDRLVETGFSPDEVAAPSLGVGRAVDPIRVELRLIPSPEGLLSGAPRLSGLLVPWSDAPRLKRLVFLLPPSVTAECRAVPLDEGLLVVGAEGPDHLPLGEPLYEAAPGVHAPLGWEVAPRLAPAVLAALCGAAEGRVIVLRAGAPKVTGSGGEVHPLRGFAIAAASFEPLSRRLLAPVPILERQRGGALDAAPVPPDGTVVNDPAGVFPLWGWKA